MWLVRALAAVPLALFVAVVAVACGDDSTDNNSGNGTTQPSSCPSPCTPGALCYQPAPDLNCNGDWYCWDDDMWHCAPPDSGGPGDATVTFDTGNGDDSGDDADADDATGPVESGPGEAGPVEAGAAETGPGEAGHD
jgi:hypothetical protein